MKELETYLGDGLYAGLENGMIGLWTERDNGTNRVFLEPEVMEAFFLFFKRVEAAYPGYTKTRSVSLSDLRKAWDRIVGGGEFEDSRSSKWFMPFAEELGFSWEDE